MSREFSSMGALGLHLAKVAAGQMIAAKLALDEACLVIEDTAKEEIGHYQSEAGISPAWAQLADSTEADKARKGFPLDAPLLRTGDMRDAITHEVSGLEAVVGAKEEGAGKMLIYHEFGTSKMPPRPVLWPAWYRNKDRILRIVAEAMISEIIGVRPPIIGKGQD